MTDRRFNEEEVAAIFKQATEAQQTPQRQLPSGDGLTLAEPVSSLSARCNSRAGPGSGESRWKRSLSDSPSRRLHCRLATGSTHFASST